MFYAHKGNSTDNTFNDRRSFYAFDTKAERRAAQDKVWADSNGEANLIFCTRRLVTQEKGRNFVILEDGQVVTRAAYEQMTTYEV